MGALVVLADDPEVLSICSGGFLLDAPYSPQRLSELAKMDGAIIIGRNGDRIARANVHLVPDPNIPTSETGTRHRTAERVARSLGVPVVSVSEDMSVIAVYVDGVKHVIEEIPRLLSRANQAMQTLERYKARLDHAAAAVSALEVENLVTVRDVAMLLQRSEMLRRIADEIETYTVELGTDARLIRLQHDELMSDTEDDRHAIVDDYIARPSPGAVDDAVVRLAELTTDDLVDLRHVANVLGLATADESLDTHVTARGYRLLHQMPNLPRDVAEQLVERFGSLPRLQRATTAELQSLPDVDRETGEMIRDGVARLTESAILDRYR